MYHIYGKNNCIYCTMSKNLLDRKGLPYKFLNVQENENHAAMFSNIFPDAKTFPQIIYMDDWNRKVIGGYTELEALLRQ